MLVLFVLLACGGWACQKFGMQDSSIRPSEEVAPEAPRTNDSTTHRTMRFSLVEFSSVIPDFRDTALKSLDMVAGVLSLPEFKDSILKYDFHESNAWNERTRSRTCPEGKGNRIVHKVDPETGRVLGATVYADLLMEPVATVKLQVLASTGSSGYGQAIPCGYIQSFDWFLKGEDASYQYALNIIHEFCHTLGYMHSSARPPGEDDVAYRVTSIVDKIIKRRRNE